MTILEFLIDFFSKKEENNKTKNWEKVAERKHIRDALARKIDL